MSTNREFKNSVFATLFSDPKRLLSLYNAVSESQLPADTPITIATLDDVLFTDWRNDVAFVINDKIVILVEHQSSISGNMPLRLLIYVARVYEKLIDKDAIYKRKVLKIPKPDFIVLYNGAEKFPEEKTLRLSEAYEEMPEVLTGLGGSLELEVRVVNINEGNNEALVKKCEELYGYTNLVGKIRRHQEIGMDRDAAVTKAVKECIKEGILASFLKAHSSEVINMLTEEWNLERAIFVREQEAREEGIDIGREEGIDIGREEGIGIGRGRGREEGVSIIMLILRDIRDDVPIAEIAVRYQVSIDMVQEIRSAL